MNGLQGQVALVTGGSSGIGQAIAIRLGTDGASVAINYVGRSEGAVSTREAIEHGVEICMKQVAEAGGRPILVSADVSDEHAVERMFDRVMTEYGRLDILVNNAGIQIAEDSHELSAADFDKVLAVNLRGAFLCARQAIRTFLAAERPGVIVNVSSVHQVIPKPRFLGYSVSKGGMQNLTRSLALEYAARGIRVNGIGPGATVTPINRSWIDDPVKRRMVEEHIPMRRAGGSEEMAAAVAFLCSGEAAYITGQTLFIDGGLTLYPSFETTWSSELAAHGADQPGRGGEGDPVGAGVRGDRGREGVQRALAPGAVETVEHPAQDAEHEAVRVIGIGAEPHGSVQPVERDVGEPRGGQQGPGPAGIGQRERARGTGRRGGDVPPGRQRAAELADPLVRPRALPRQHHQPPAGAQRPADVGERGDRVTEEHRPGPRDRHVERPGGEGVDLRVGLLEAGVADALARGELPGQLDHPPAKIHAQRRPRPGRRGGVPVAWPVPQPMSSTRSPRAMPQAAMSVPW